MTPAELQAAVVRALRRAEMLYAFGVDRAVLVADRFEGADGISIYLVVQPEWFQEVGAEPGYRYPTWLIVLYGELLAALKQEAGEDVAFIQNEALAVARLMLTKAKVVKIPGLNIGLLGLRLALTESDEVAEGYYHVPHSHLMDMIRKAGKAERDELLANDDNLSPELKQKVISGANDGDMWLNRMETELGPWFEPEVGMQQWLQITVVPSSDPASLADEQVLKAWRLTRAGFNYYEPRQDAAEIAEIRRHLSNPTETVELG